MLALRWEMNKLVCITFIIFCDKRERERERERERLAIKLMKFKKSIDSMQIYISDFDIRA